MEKKVRAWPVLVGWYDVLLLVVIWLEPYGILRKLCANYALMWSVHMCLMTGSLVLLYSLFPSRLTVCDNFRDKYRNLLYEEKGICGLAHLFTLKLWWGCSLHIIITLVLMRKRQILKCETKENSSVLQPESNRTGLTQCKQPSLS